MSTYIEEWASPNFHDSMFAPFAVMLLLLVTFLALSNKRMTAGETLLLVVASLGALRSARHIPIFALIAAPILARQGWDILVSRGWDKPFTQPESRPTAIAFSFAMLFLLAPFSLAAFRLWHFVTNERSYEAQKYPVAAVEFIGEKQVPGPIFNEYTWGGYLIRRLHPNYRVYIDGRADVYGDSFMAETVGISRGDSSWKEALKRSAVRTVLIDPQSALATLLRSDRDWERLYEDQQSVIFSIKSSEIASVHHE